MKKNLLWAVGLSGLAVFAWADPPQEIPQPPKISSGDISVALTGESDYAPVPRGMTESPEESFFTLHRSLEKRSEGPTTIDVVRGEDLHAYGARHAGEAIARILGVQTVASGENGSPYYAGLRGAGAQSTLIMMDGRPLTGIALDPPDLTEIPLEQIDRIEIVRGNLSALYGPNAAGGVINILSKRAVNRGLPLSHFSYEPRSYSGHTSRIDFGSRAGPVDYFFFGNAQRLSGFRDNTDLRAHNIGGNLGIPFGHANKLIMDAGNYHRHTGVPGPDPLNLGPSSFNNKDEKLATRPNAATDINTLYARTSVVLGLANDQTFAIRAFDTEHSQEYDDLSNSNPTLAWKGEDDSQSKGGEVAWKGPLGFSAGASYLRDRLLHDDAVVSTRSYVAATENVAFYAQERVLVGPLTLTTAGRYDRVSGLGDAFSPRAELLSDLSSHVRLSASASRGLGVPRLADRFTNSPFHIANPSLRMEKSTSYDAGLEVHYTSGSARVSVFRSDVENALVLQPLTFNALRNVDDVRRQGIEFNWAHSLNSVFRDEIRVTLLSNRGRPQGFQERVTLAQSAKEKIDWLMTLTPGKKWRIDSLWRYEGARWSEDQERGRRLGAEFLWDFRLTHPWRQADLYVGVNNAFDRRYEDAAGYPLPGRTYYGGVSIRLWG